MYYITYGLLYVISLLPMWFLYGLSDGLALLLYFVIRYRRGVVLSNLLIAFPKKTESERRAIARRFYRNFTDSFIETIKLLSASRAFLRKRFVLDNPELLEHYYAQGKKVQLHMGHIFNWEIANVAVPLDTSYTFIVIYMPLENKVFERLFLHLRGRTGTVLLPATNMQRAILPYRNSQYMLALVADQAPSGPERSYWLNFFGRPTPFVRTPERGARIANIPAVFARIYKTRRGYYRAELKTLSDDPASLPEGELTRLYRSLLEDGIRAQPDAYLWSHKRWKKEWKEEYAPLWIDESPENNAP
ncbi:MAG: lysophospholipid acyltransferase family protein [Bacteroidetes bacterium]|nr:lysophospholipid acyltransferase family protein [Bacteroidota bacterium]